VNFTPDFSKRKHIITEDGSVSFQLCDAREAFHSIYGAKNESLHIYIHAGLDAISTANQHIHIFEMGFGTGLNAILTLQHKKNKKIRYHCIEAYPLSPAECLFLNDYPYFSLQEKELWMNMHQQASGIERALLPDFIFKKEISFLENMNFKKNSYDLVYFDAFSPDIQPELWSEDVFSKLFQAIKPNGILVTYCAKGIIKRSLKTCGFQIESLPGPTGKREITRARKLIHVS